MVYWISTLDGVFDYGLGTWFSGLTQLKRIWCASEVAVPNNFNYCNAGDYAR